jgi:thiol-disulfide isomerase/thioredoxin
MDGKAVCGMTCGWLAALFLGGPVEGFCQTSSSPPWASAAVVHDVPLREGVFRHSRYPAAWRAAQQSGRLILVYVTSTRCPHCVRMVEKTYRDEAVRASVAESFEAVYVDRATQPELVAKLGVQIFPTTVIVSPSNQVLDVMTGYVDAATFHQRLQAKLAANSATVTR